MKANLKKLFNGLKNIQQNQPNLISSNNVKRAAVALILRLNVNNSSCSSSFSVPPTLEQVFDSFWLNENKITPEILFIQRAARKGDRWSSHVACPGGRYEPSDDSLKYTAMRETYEEISLDLATPDFLYIGQLDDREVTSSLGKRLLMILSPFVFLQTTPQTPVMELEPDEVQSVHWIPLNLLTYDAKYTRIDVDLPSRLSPKSNIGNAILSTLLLNSTLSFPAIEIPNRPVITSDNTSSDLKSNNEDNEMDYAPPTPAQLDETVNDIRNRKQNTVLSVDNNNTCQYLKLWGLTLGMTLDFIANFPRNNEEGVPDAMVTRHKSTAHVIKALFPSFNSPDINLWMWVFGRRYRSVRRQWEHAAQNPGSADKRRNWSGTIRSAHFATIRRALVFTIFVRIFAAFTTFSIFGKYISNALSFYFGGGNGN